MKVQVNDAERSQKELLVEIPFSAQVKHLEILLENNSLIKLNHRLLKKL